MKLNTDAPIKVVSYGRVSNKNSPWHIGRSINYNLFVYIESGSLKMQIGDEIFSVSKGGLLLIPGKTFYRPLAANGLSYYFIHFTADTEESVSDELHFQSNPLLPEGDYEFSYHGGTKTVTIPSVSDCSSNETVKRIFRRIAELNVRSGGEKLMLDCLGRELIIAVCEENHPEGKLSSNMVRITSFIDQMFFEDITLTSLSEKFGFSKSYIARLFKNELGTTSADYINRTRIANSCRLLLCSDKNICEISEAVGFKNQYYFTRIFKKEIGITPSEYKKRNLTA